MAAFNTLNKDLLCELLTYMSPSTASSLALTARQFLDDARSALYRRVRVRSHVTARLFFRTMHSCSPLHPSSPQLACIVRVLHLLRAGPRSAGEYDEILRGDDFDYGLECMRSLETIHLELRVDFLSFKNRCNYTLSEFAYDGPIEEELYCFLFLTPTLTTVLLKQDFDRTAHQMQDPDFLPNVSHLSVCHQDAMAFLEDRPVSQLTLEYPDLFVDYQTIYSALSLSQFRGQVPITFFQAAPAQWLHGPRLARYLPELETAAILQDGSWTTTRGLSRHFPELVTELVQALNFLPKLTTLLLLTRLGALELLVFQDALQKYSTLPALRQLTFHNPLESCVHGTLVPAQPQLPTTPPSWPEEGASVHRRKRRVVHLSLLAGALGGPFGSSELALLLPAAPVPAETPPAFCEGTQVERGISLAPTDDPRCSAHTRPGPPASVIGQPTSLGTPLLCIKLLLRKGAGDDRDSCAFLEHFEIKIPPSQDTLPTDFASLIPMPRTGHDLIRELKHDEDVTARSLRIRTALQHLVDSDAVTKSMQLSPKTRSNAETTAPPSTSSTSAPETSPAASSVMWLVRKKRKLYFDPMHAHTACKKLKAKSVTLVQSFDEAAALLDVETDSD
ncbi:hypothetical protein C8J57DRAFT_1489961 [Mycena rebaudengoi]|nr:hypothetical protein C8J57DRAFT_1489961 [Mycena rebaudengoi]